jgi:peptide deformylase
MAIRNIRQEGDEILKKKSREVEVIDEKIKELIEDMVETMHKYNGVGLAAVQVGILKRVIVIDTYEEDTPIVKLINPKIVKQKGSREVEEGCLSFPNKFAKVIRPTEVVVEGLNENGEKVKIKAVELLAQALCHEIDHLNGITFVDIMEPGTLEYVEPQN